MHYMLQDILPVNLYWVGYYLHYVWPKAFALAGSLVARELPDWLDGKFQDYVVYEEDRIRKNLRDIHYRIDSLETLSVVAGPGRIEKACDRTIARNISPDILQNVYALLYLLLERDIEVFNLAKTQILHRDELFDSVTNCSYIYDLIDARYTDLKGAGVWHFLCGPSA